MALTDVFNKAKEVRDRAVEAAETGLDKTKELTELSRDKTIELTEQAKDASGRLADAGREKMQEALNRTLAEAQSLGSILARAGLSTEDIAISMAFPPGVTLEIYKTGVGKETLEELENEEGLSRLQSSVIHALKNTYAMDGVVKKYGYAIGMIEAEIGLTPGVKVHLTKIEKD